MPKLNINPRNNKLSLSGIADFNAARLNQYVLTTSDTTFNSLNLATNLAVGGSGTVAGDFLVDGNLTVMGNATIINSDITTIKDNIVVFNSEEMGAGVTIAGGLSGMEIERGSLTNYQTVFEENTRLFKIGQVGNLQCVATREDNPLPFGAMVFNSVLDRIDSTQIFTLPMSFTSGVSSTSSSTGSALIVGGLGITGNICSDGYLAVKGTDYSNYIRSDINNNFIINSGNNLVLAVPSSKNITIPQNVNVTFGSNGTIASNGTTMTLANSAGSVNITTISNGTVNLNAGTFIGWGGTSNSIRYNSTNIVLASTGNFTVNTVLNITSVVSSTSTTLGAIVTVGGISTSCSSDAVSSSSGGSFTAGGGMGILKTLFVGKTLIVGDTTINSTAVAGQGTNFRSLQRTLTTLSNNDITFNSFEGGNVSSSSSSINSASTVYIASSPTISGGGSITNSYSLYINSGLALFGGGIQNTSTTPSTSATIGALVLLGGISTSCSVNAASVTNGGSFTSSGGMSVALDSFFGGKLTLGVSNAEASQVSGQGVNLRSVARTITTTSGNDLCFNSFEGGVISGTTGITNISTVFIDGAPTISGATALNSYSFFVGSGVSRFDGSIVCNNTTTSTNSVTGSIITTGGISTNCTVDATSYTSGGAVTVTGGLAIGKTIYSNFGYYSNNGTGNHVTLQNGSSTRISLSLNGTESGSNVGSDFQINTYTDSGTFLSTPLIVTRTGIVSIGNTTASTSSTTGAVLLTGGISINNNTNATSYTNGGSLTSDGGFAFNGDGYINGSLFINTNLTVGGITDLNRTSINTNNGSFTLSGTNSFSFISGSASLLRTTSGSVTLEAISGSANVNGSTRVNITSSAGNFVITGNTASTITATAGLLSMSGLGVTINGNTAGVNVLCSNIVDGVNIATVTAAVPVNIGSSSSTVTVPGELVVGGNLVVNGDTLTINSTIVSIEDIAFIVNNMPTGISDGGFLIRRFQQPNGTASGQVVGDTPKIESTFGSGSSLPGTLVLNASASSVDGYYSGWWIEITSGAGINQVRRIDTYTGQTRTATLYTTSNNNVNNDGLDLVTAPVSGDSYQLFDIPYAGIYYAASGREFRFAGVPFDQSSGVFGTPTSYLNLHCNSFVTETGYTTNGDCRILSTSTNAFSVGSTGAIDNTGYIFSVDTLNKNISVSNPVNTVSSTRGIHFNGLGDGGTLQEYSSIYSEITGVDTASLLLNTQVSGVSTNFITLQGSTSTTIFNTITNFASTTSSSSASAGSAVFSGGISISNTTDATSTTSGGGSTIGGGLAVTKKIYVGGGIYSTNTNSVGSGNTFTGTEGNTNINGDFVLYNNISQTIYFNGFGSGIPSVTTRSLGTKIVLKTGLSASTTDYALGINGNSLWTSTLGTFDWYLNDTSIVTIGSFGIQCNTNGTGLRLSNGNTFANVYTNTNDTRLVPISRFVFRDAADSQDNVSISSFGGLTVFNSNITAAPSTLFKVESNTFTDSQTSGTLDTFIFNSFGQTTLAAINASTTTTKAIGNYIRGAVIKGTNQTITNSYALYIDNVTSVGTVTNAYSLYIADAPTISAGNRYSMYIDGTGVNYFNSFVGIGSTAVVSDTTNTMTSLSGAFNVSGDTVFSATNTRQSLFFNTSSLGVPTTTTRSAGTRLVLLASTTAGTTDYALGVSTESLWYSAASNTSNHSWYLGNSRRMLLDNTGLTFTSSGSTVNFVQNVSNNTSGMTLVGGTSTGVNNGAQIDLFGTSNVTFPGLINLSAGTGGNIQLSTSNSLWVTLDMAGKLISTCDIDSTSSSGAIYTPGGISAGKSLYAGTALVLNFNQAYTFSGDTTGALNVQSGTSGVASKIRLFSANNQNSVMEFYGLGVSSALVNSEFLSIGYASSLGMYTVNTNSTGTGTARALVLQTGNNLNQILLGADGTVSVNTGTLTTLKINVSDTTDAGVSTGSIVTDGGMYIAKSVIVNTDLTVNGNFSGGINSSQTTTISSIVNSGDISPVNIKTVTNGNEVLLTLAFQFTPVATNTKTSFRFTMPFISTDFINVYDVVFSLSGMFYNGSEYIDVNNLRAYAVTGTTTASIVFTSGNISSALHTLMVTARYTKP